LGIFLPHISIIQLIPFGARKNKLFIMKNDEIMTVSLVARRKDFAAGLLCVSCQRRSIQSKFCVIHEEFTRD
jgi:hypothetical protein